MVGMKKKEKVRQFISASACLFTVYFVIYVYLMNMSIIITLI